MRKWADPNRPDTDPVPDLDWDIETWDSHPQLILASIVAVLDSAGGDAEHQFLHVLSAGPLENLLKAHGPAVIAQVEDLAHERQDFAELLGGVWWDEEDMDPDVARRVAAARREFPW